MESVEETKNPADIEIQKNNSRVLKFFVISTILVIAMSFLRFFIIKNYDIFIEAVCDPTTSTCFVRDCETGECPPNNFEIYHEYIIKGFDFARCNPTDTCAKFCSNPKNCEEIKCDGEAGDECIGPEIQTE